MVVKTKKLNKQRNKHRNKYTSTKSKVSRRTRKNDLVLRGNSISTKRKVSKSYRNKRTRKNNLVLRGGSISDDFEIYYKNSRLFSSDKIKPYSDSKSKLEYIDENNLYNFPNIKINNKTPYKYEFTFSIVPINDKFEKINQRENITFKYVITRNKGFFSPKNNPSKEKDIPNDQLKALLKTYKNIRISVNIIRRELNNLSSYKDKFEYYFNLTTDKKNLQ